MEHFRRRLRQWFHVKPAPAPEKRLPCRPRQSGGVRCHDRICRASLTDGTRSAPPKADASATFFRGSSPSYPAEHDVLDGRPATGHWEAASSYSSRATAYALPASEEGEGITSHQQLEITAPTLGDVCRVSRNIAVGRFTIGFT